MADRAHVPKFGNWESEENVPYTVYFEKARKGKGRTGGKMINPNDPQENPDMFPDVAPPAQAQAQAPPSRTRTAPEEPIGQVAVRPTHERRVSREDVDAMNSTDSLARNGNTPRKTANDHQRHGGRGAGSGRPARQSAGSEHSIERSPLHPHYQARIVGKSSGSPSREGRNSYDGSHGTPGRSRLKPVTQGDESPDRGAAVPRFGEWDEKNPSSADNYTHIFNRVREERHTGPGKSPGRDSEHSYNNIRKQNQNDNAKICCFPWGRK
ncbi:RPM1-interacting protein 4-like [Cornus florida]|uniref:RPM1-interacting protein 4-like n=1 Tax=Cornus florida TaxID=4283 RepID=UPI00289CE787|nr:RPM1-interacting protein 4-like [Cornus florida]